jgi:glycosyltransferase involved in cell wall biosynthesis
LNLFSIIIPTYNREDKILRALASVKNQTYRPIQAIIIDDGSTDNTLEIAIVWKSENEGPDFTVEVHKQNNAGASAARNKGILQIKGEYVQFLDSDDVLHPHRLEILVNEFQKGADFVHTGFANFVESPEKPISVLNGNIDLPLKSQIIQGRAWLNTLRDAMTTILLKKTGYWNQELVCFEDREFMERAALLSYKPVVIKDVLAYAERSVGERISDKQKTKIGRHIRIECEKYIVDQVKKHDFGTSHDKTVLKSRLYGLALRTKASGWFQLADECFQLAESVSASLDKKAKQRKFIYQTGYIGSNIYILGAKFIKPK